MPVKSIIDVEVNTAAFSRFQELFGKYQEQLAKTPSVWAKANAEQADGLSHFEKMSALLMANAQLQRENDEADEHRLKRLTTSEKLWTSISRSSGNIAKSVLDIGSGILRWGGLLAGVATGAGLFGIDRLAQHTADQRRSSLGLGVVHRRTKSL